MSIWIRNAWALLRTGKRPLRLLLLCAGFATSGVCAETYKVLVFSRTLGFRHESITNGWAMIQELGAAHGFAVDISEDATAFSDANLAKYKAVIWLSTTGDVLDSSQQAAFERFIQSGRGFVGIHSAADTEYSWPWYGQLVGAYFSNHPPGTASATIKVADPVHPSAAPLPRRWVRTDEWYNFQTNPRGTVHVLATLDETTYAAGTGAMGFDHPIAWCRYFDGGRAWYTALGHTPECYSEAAFRQHVLGGIEWAGGIKGGDAGSTIDANFQKVILDASPNQAMELAIARDGRVFIAERSGVLKIWKPENASLSVAAQLPVFSQLEDGLLGVALDPGFETNQWVYLFYSAVGVVPKQHLSRFTMTGNTLDLGSERILLTVPTQRDQCCHSGGSLAFGPDGCLFLSVGDNTNPFESGGYAPIDERPGRSPWDAQKSSANANDLRGKILRIRPQPDGTYTIPSGNLFPPGTPGTRPEVYVMGNRNPFRISVDQATGWLYWGEVGPDASGANASLGPVGHDEWNQARSAGNYGWPYFVGNNYPYRDYDFASGISGPAFDPAAPVNKSPNNTGITNLPPARPAWIWTQRSGTTPEFPELLAGPIARCAMGGPVYHFNPLLNSPHKLPAYYDKTVFIFDWVRNYLWEVKLDANGDVLKINRFLSTFSFVQPHEMEIGPDGAIYMIEFGSGNNDARVSRIEYTAGSHSPVAIAKVTPDSGGVPLNVQFSSAGTFDPDAADTLSYAWSFFGDGSTNSTDPSPQFTYTTPGNYTARLSVHDPSGNQAVVNLPVTVGNNRPLLTIAWPPDGSVFDWGEIIPFAGRIFDPEDGSTTNGLIPCGRLIWDLAVGHDIHSHGIVQTNGCTGYLAAPGIHGNDGDNVFLVLRASSADNSVPPARSLVGEATCLLQPRLKQAEHFTHQSGVTNQVAGDSSGNFEVAGIDHGDYISFSPVNLTSITGLTFRVIAGGPGGRIEVRQDSPTGTLLATADIPNTGGSYTQVTVPVSNPGGTHELCLVFVRTPGAADLFRLNWMEFVGDGVSTVGTLRIVPIGGGKYLISFPEGGATLVWSATLSGPWQSVTPPPANGQYEVTPDGVSRFYRLQWP